MIELHLTWLDFFRILISLILILGLLKFVFSIALKLIKKQSVKRKAKIYFDVVLGLYKPIILLITMVSFVIIDYRVHGVVMLVLGIVLIPQIKNYCSGVLFKINPLVDKGVNLVTEDYQGEIQKLLQFGLILKVGQGERYINYSTIDKQGFCVNQKADGSRRKTIYLLEPDKINEVMDLLFENPLIDFHQKPSVWNIQGESMQQIQLTLEHGAKIEVIIDYLNQNNIKASLTKQ